MKLPPIPNPQRYTGLFVYDFGDHVSVGYTAAEVRILRASSLHRTGQAFQIYRVDESGTIELRGILDDRLDAQEAVCFLRSDGVDARRDYDALINAAHAFPLGCECELQLGKLYDFEPPHVTAMVYFAGMSLVVSGWLSRRVPEAGDLVVGGTDALAQLLASDGVRIATHKLECSSFYRDREEDEVLSAIEEPLQR